MKELEIGRLNRRCRGARVRGDDGVERSVDFLRPHVRAMPGARHESGRRSLGRARGRRRRADSSSSCCRARSSATSRSSALPPKRAAAASDRASSRSPRSESSPSSRTCSSASRRSIRAPAQLYERLGYKLVGELDDYLVRGYSEFLMRKSVGPLAEFLRKADRGLTDEEISE